MASLAERFGVRKRAVDLEALRGLVTPSADVHLLDVGGGAGTATERFASGCSEIVVLEPDSRKVAVGRRRRSWIRFEEGHAERIPFPEGSFDRVVAVVAFHHVENKDQALEEMRRVLRPSGRVVLFELPPSLAPGRFMRWIARCHHTGPLGFLEPGELVEKLEAHGFRDVAMRQGIRGYFVSARKGSRDSDESDGSES